MKARIVAIGIFDGAKKSIVSPVSAKLEVPMIEKKTSQVVSVSQDTVQMMDLETYGIFFAPKPTEEDVMSKIEAGREVEYWKVLDRIKIVRVKGSS